MERVTDSRTASRRKTPACHNQHPVGCPGNRDFARKRELWKCRAVESVESQKQASHPFPRALGNLAQDGEIPTFPPLRRRRRMEKWKNQKQVFHFPTASIPLFQNEQERA